MKIRITILVLISVMAVQLFASCTSQNQNQTQAYTLTQSQSDLVELIYNERYVWESSDCHAIRYVRKNGNDFLLVSVSKGSTGVTLNGSALNSSSEKKYIIDLDAYEMREASGREYGSADVGLVTGMVSYSSSYSSEEKLDAIARAVSGESEVVIPDLD